MFTFLCYMVHMSENIFKSKHQVLNLAYTGRLCHDMQMSRQLTWLFRIAPYPSFTRLKSFSTNKCVRLLCTQMLITVPNRPWIKKNKVFKQLNHFVIWSRYIFYKFFLSQISGSDTDPSDVVLDLIHMVRVYF